jgi:hypothetical protein
MSSANRKYSASGPTTAAPRTSPYRTNRQTQPYYPSSTISSSSPPQQQQQLSPSPPPLSSSSSPRLLAQQAAAEPSVRTLRQQRSMSPDQGLLPPPIPQVHQTRSTDSMNTTDGSALRRLCAKCGQPIADKFVRAMGKKFHLDCFRCHVLPPSPPVVNSLSIN